MANRLKYLLFSLAFLLLVVLTLSYLLERRAESDTAGPAQPIAFSHKVHAGENSIPCQYCHSYAHKAETPGIPSLRACMGCHKFIAGSDRKYDYNGTSINFKEEIKKLRGYWERKEPIPWRKYHFVPQFARFKHQPHIRAGLQCETCHGDVKTMDVVKPVHVINMGFCVSCHRQREMTQEELAAHAAQGKELTYMRDCVTCHY